MIRKFTGYFGSAVAARKLLCWGKRQAAVGKSALPLVTVRGERKEGAGDVREEREEERIKLAALSRKNGGE